MKAVLISTQPKWCGEIATLKKKVEIRKSKPTGSAPFKCYIYCTKAKEHFSIGGGVYATSDTLYRLPTGEIKFGDSFELMGDWSGQYDESNFLNGKIIGEFICKKVEKFVANYQTAHLIQTEQIAHSACIPMDELVEYGYKSFHLYAWHISDLVIYDKPKELSDLYIKRYSNGSFEKIPVPVKRPPQSWCYVEELT